MKYEEVKKAFPKQRQELPAEYKAIYDQHYEENRKGMTKASSLSSKMESWLHRKVAKTGGYDKKTLEIGAGTLNQLDYERCERYDIVEPYEALFEHSMNKKYIHNIYKDVLDIPSGETYDRIISIACFEHICNLPEIVQKTSEMLRSGGILAVSIPNQGRFLWKLAYTMTTGSEFKKRFGLDYETLMNYEHVNTADEIEVILKHFFRRVKRSFLGVGKTFSLYRYYECSKPKTIHPNHDTTRKSKR